MFSCKKLSKRPVYQGRGKANEKLDAETLDFLRTNSLKIGLESQELVRQLSKELEEVS